MSSSKKPAFLQGDAYQEILTTRHLQRAVNDIILCRFGLLDPVIGDAGCENRGCFILDIHSAIIDLLVKGNAWNQARELVRAYEVAHANDKPDTQVKTVEDARGAKHDKEYDNMIAALTKGLTPNELSYLSLCGTHSRTGAQSHDEFGNKFSFRSKPLFSIQTDQALKSGNQKDLLHLEGPMRSELANLATKYFIKKTSRLPRNNPSYVPGDEVTAHDYVEEQLIEALHHMRSVVPSPISAEFDIPVMDTYIQFRAIALQEFNDERGLLLKINRICLTPLSKTGSGDPSYAYSYGGSIVLLFQPNKESGRFEPVELEALEDEDRPFFFVDAWSSFVAGSFGKGLDAADNEEYKQAIRRSDPWWLILQSMAVHPAFAGNAKDKGDNHPEILKSICENIDDSFTTTREDCEGLNFKRHIPGERRPSLFNEFQMAKKLAETGASTEPRLALMPKDKYFIRPKRPVFFALDHARCSTLREVTEEVLALQKKHEAASDAIIGGFVARMGDQAVSFTTQEDVETFVALKRSNAKRKFYIDKFPQNQALFIKERNDVASSKPKVLEKSEAASKRKKKQIKGKRQGRERV